MEPNKRATFREVPAQLGPTGSSGASVASQGWSHPEASVLPAVGSCGGWEGLSGTPLRRRLKVPGAIEHIKVQDSTEDWQEGSEGSIVPAAAFTIG